jgi:hypothetical protein
MGGVNGALDYVTTMGLGYVTPGVDGAKPTATVTQSTKQVSRRQRIYLVFVPPATIPLLNCCLHTGRNRLGLLYVPIVSPSRFQPDTGFSPDLGTLLGCLLGGWLGDRLGRKKTIWIGCIWITIGAPLQVSRSSLLPPFRKPRFHFRHRSEMNSRHRSGSWR